MGVWKVCERKWCQQGKKKEARDKTYKESDLHSNTNTNSFTRFTIKYRESRQWRVGSRQSSRQRAEGLVGTSLALREWTVGKTQPE